MCGLPLVPSKKNHRQSNILGAFGDGDESKSFHIPCVFHICSDKKVEPKWLLSGTFWKNDSTFLKWKGGHPVDMEMVSLIIFRCTCFVVLFLSSICSLK